jgi:hypothetical protein
MSHQKISLHLDNGEIPEVKGDYSEGAIWINIGDEITIFFQSFNDREAFVNQLHKKVGTPYWAAENQEAA